ncbi:ATP-binding protein [Kitasatospora sp. NPDC001175]|uniref:ATP-binding protein n=1 Tax=Kitasatospora sp. NPDC001175 TaxID=3157103 RepID=UPI003D065000
MWARQLLRELLADVEDGHLYAETGELLVSELVTNAVRHGRVPGRLLWVRLELRVGLLRVEVHDASSDRPTARTPGVEDESGRGLWLVEQLSVRWGWHPRSGGVGKAVWAECAPAAGGKR